MKIFNASRTGGVVTANNLPVPNCEVLGEGGNSSGYLLIAEGKFFYLPKTTPDVKSFLIQIENLCGKLETLCDSIKAITVTCAAPASPSGTPLNSAAFDTAKSDITAIHEALTDLKGILK
jgi:hypothetical protein